MEPLLSLLRNFPFKSTSFTVKSRYFDVVLEVVDLGEAVEAGVAPLCDLRSTVESGVVCCCIQSPMGIVVHHSPSLLKEMVNIISRHYGGSLADA